MAGEVVVDALPYFDQGYEEPGVRDAVRNDAELRRNIHNSFVTINNGPIHCFRC